MVAEEEDSGTTLRRGLTVTKRKKVGSGKGKGKGEEKDRRLGLVEGHRPRIFR